jgi:hypothetical protein
MRKIFLALCSSALLPWMALPSATEAAVTTPAPVTVEINESQDITETAQRLVFELDDLPRAGPNERYGFINFSVQAQGDFSPDNPDEYLDVFLDGAHLIRLTGYYEDNCCDVAILAHPSIGADRLHEALADHRLEFTFQAGPAVNVFAGIPVGDGDILSFPSFVSFGLDYSLAPVPIPAAGVLLAPALLALGSMARRRRA